MKNQKSELILLIVSIASFLLLSLAFVLMPLKNITGMAVFSILPGIMFWLFLLLGILTQVLLANKRKNWIVKNKAQMNAFYKKRIGIFSFAQNPPAIIADVICMLSIIAFVVAMYLTNGTGFRYICIAIAIFSFCMHCILNGKIYDYITKKNKITKSRKGVKENG